MAKWSTPGIAFAEEDNTIRANAEPGNGIGAIVLKANKGYVNQRVLSTSRKKFHENFGDQESVTDYGHFAADLYLSTSPQMLGVRVTNGDEQYSFIQYPLTSAGSEDYKISELEQSFEFVDNEGVDHIELLNKLTGKVELDALVNGGWQTIGGSTTTSDMNSAFALVDTGSRSYIKDVFTNSEQYLIYRDTPMASANTANSGTYYSIPNSNAGLSEFGLNGLAASIYCTDTTDTNTNPTDLYCIVDSTAAPTGDYVLSYFNIPTSASINGQKINFSAYVSTASVLYDTSLTSTTATSAPVSGVFIPTAFSGTSFESKPIAKVTLENWSNLANDTFYVDTSAMTANTDGVSGIQFREYNEALCFNDLTLSDPVLNDISDLTDSEQTDLANGYGVEVTEIATSAYKALTYRSAIDDEVITKVIYANIVNGDKDTPDNNDNAIYLSKYIFNCYYDEKLKKLKVNSNYVLFKPKATIEPWQYNSSTSTINTMTALKTSEVLAMDEYKDGYTPYINSPDDPGNGDIERYQSLQSDQMIIAAYGPGEFGNDIGISIITPEVADIQALQHQNAFSWKYQFDDEDLVVEDYDINPTYQVNPNNLTWKKVYKINVYTKPKTKTAAVWGKGLTALLSDPIESFLVSNDPDAKDANGNSLFVSDVINGNSNYIYVSRNSAIRARHYSGSYRMPMQTHSIYQLTGGKNGTKDTINEKMAALKLYEDREKANFDILFNVDAIPTFQSREKYSALQKRIAEIASTRTMDLGIIQVTSKNAKTAKQAASEGKMFSFVNGSYVACYAGYDKYFDAITSNWVYLPKSVAAAISVAYCALNSGPWMAPAGIQRGVIDYATSQLLKINDSEIGQLYNDHINTSKSTRSYGEVLWTQKTALKKESALNRINVRTTLNYIEKNLETMLLPYLYQNNTADTRRNIKTTVDNFLGSILAAGGIISKSVTVLTDPNDSHIVYVNIEIIPAESIEWIKVTTTLNRSAQSIGTVEV